MGEGEKEKEREGEPKCTSDMVSQLISYQALNTKQCFLCGISDAIPPSPLPHLRGNIQRLTGLCGIRPMSVGGRHITLGAATAWRLPSSGWLMERLCHRWVSSLRLLLLLHAFHLRLPPSPSLRLYLLHLQSLGQLLGREKRERERDHSFQ